MSEIAIHVENIGKLYRIGERQRYKALRDTLSYGLYAPFRAAASLFNGQNGHRPTASSSSSNKYIWSLKNVSFEIKKGEAVGIIGRNGAGKSTLLKILSRITKPTEGYARVYGRVGSLLEVGTGFHPELTGRENIYLNGAIIGMRKKEIDRKFDEIVAFAEVEKFIDTPVKLYSSGMYVRLAFAVAAHLEPEILLVDEVLAVGDAAFQKKCLGKMSKVSSEGRAVLFVSHNMPFVQSLCRHSLLIENGRIVFQGDSSKVIDRYLNTESDAVQKGYVDLRNHPRRLANMTPALARMWMTDSNNKLITSVAMASDVIFHVEYQVEGQVPQPVVGLRFENLHGHSVFSVNNKMAPGAIISGGAPKAVLSCHIARLPLVAGDYFITVSFANSVWADFDKIERAYRLSVLPRDVYKTGYVPGSEHGDCILDAHWTYAPS
jgi:lipopolysaccharide transport system ATP-binding protein